MPEQRRFSERIGVNPVKAKIQAESMDSELWNSLWNLLTVHCWNKLGGFASEYSGGTHQADVFFPLVWIHFLKWPLDKKPDNDHRALAVLREQFFQSKWYEAYDFIEFTAKNYPFSCSKREPFLTDLNWVWN